MGFNCLKATEAHGGGSLLFTTKFPESLDTNLIHRQRMKDLLDVGPLDWESSTLTTMQ